MKQVFFSLSLSLCFCVSVFAQTDLKFEKTKILLGGKVVLVEVADTNEKREHGLMGRTSLGENAGMIFVFEEEHTLSFWMKDTLIPLDIGYFDKNKVLIDIQTMQPASPMEVQPKAYPSKRPAQYAIEMPMHWFARHKVSVGTKYKAVSP